MKRLSRALLFLLLAAGVPACSTSGSSPGNFTYPSSMALGYLPSSGTRTLFVANTFTGTISEINTSTNAVMAITTASGTYHALPLNLYPEFLEYHNGYLYIAGFTQSTAMLESLDLADNHTTTTQILRGYPLKTLFVPQTSMLYVLDAAGSSVSIESFTAGSVITPAASAPLDFTPSSLATTPDGGSLLISSRDKAIIGVYDPVTLRQISLVHTDYPITVMHTLDQYDRTMLYAMALNGTGYVFESIDVTSGSVGYEFTVPGIPDDFAITSQRVLLNDGHFSYLGIVANADGYLHFLDIDYGCNIPSTPSSVSGLRLTSSVPTGEAPSIQAITTNDCTTQSEAWSVIYGAGSKDYTVIGSLSGLQPFAAVDGGFFDSLFDRVSFYINPGTMVLNNDDLFSFNTTAAQGTNTVAGLGLPQHVITDPVTGQAYISDILTNSIDVVSPSTQGIVATIK